MAERDEKVPIHDSDGIPKARTGRASKYDWDRLEVNQYIVVESRSHASYTTTAKKFCERRGFNREFVYRGPSTNEKGEHRIYRYK